ncbi:MAG: FkbM family methyltransferase [Stenotrophomonas sp.]
MNKLVQLRQTHEDGQSGKQDYIEAAHAWHAHLFAYPAFLESTDVEALCIRPEGVFVRSRSQRIELLLDPEDRHLVPFTLMNFREYETAETEFLKSLMHANSTVLDIGANCGWHSLAMSRHCPTARIHAFEPIPYTHDILLRNIQHNDCLNIEAHQTALSNQDGPLEFLYTPRCSGATSMAEAGQPVPPEQLEKITCSGTTLDNFCAKHGLTPDIIKCDVEGAELMVIQGGLSILETHRPVILVELLRKWSRRFGYHPNDVLMLLAGYGYQAHTLSASGLERCHGIDEKTVETNFVFLHQQKHG